MERETLLANNIEGVLRSKPLIMTSGGDVLGDTGPGRPACGCDLPPCGAVRDVRAGECASLPQKPLLASDVADISC